MEWNGVGYDITCNGLIRLLKTLPNLRLLSFNPPRNAKDDDILNLFQTINKYNPLIEALHLIRDCLLPTVSIELYGREYQITYAVIDGFNKAKKLRKLRFHLNGVTNAGIEMLGDDQYQQQYLEELYLDGG